MGISLQATFPRFGSNIIMNDPNLAAAATRLVITAVLGNSIVAAPSVLVALVHVADDTLLGYNIGAVRPCYEQVRLPVLSWTNSHGTAQERRR